MCTTQEDIDDVLICCVGSKFEFWIMDSGASFYYSPCKDLMKIFKTGNFRKVRLADDETLDIPGMRDINLRTSTCIVWTLEDVKYVLGLKRMLISMDMLDVQGYDSFSEMASGRW